MDPISKVLLGIGAAIIGILSIAVFWFMLANAHLKTQLAQLQANDTACHMANDDFAASVKKQNTAIDALKTAATARDLKEAAEAKAAQKTSQGFLDKAAALSKRKPLADACKDADDIANAYLGSLK